MWLLAACQVRDNELALIRKTAVVKTLNLCLVFAVPPAIALVIFATYAYSVGPLTSSMAFVVLSLFNTLRFPLVVLPKALRGASGELCGCHWQRLSVKSIAVMHAAGAVIAAELDSQLITAFEKTLPIGATLQKMHAACLCLQRQWRPCAEFRPSCCCLRASSRSPLQHHRPSL